MNEKTATAPAQPAATSGAARPETLRESLDAVCKTSYWPPVCILAGMILAFIGSFWWAAGAIGLGFLSMKSKSGGWLMTLLIIAFVLAHIGALKRIGYFNGAPQGRMTASAPASAQAVPTLSVQMAPAPSVAAAGAVQQGSFPISSGWTEIPIPRGFAYHLDADPGVRMEVARKDPDGGYTSVDGGDSGKYTCAIAVRAAAGSRPGNVAYRVWPAPIESD